MVPARFLKQGQGFFNLLSVLLFLTSSCWCPASALPTVQAYKGAVEVPPAESFISNSGTHHAASLAGFERNLLQTGPILCYRGQVQCPSGIAECYDLYKSCNGNNDCSDGSDESNDFCAGFLCEMFTAKCPSGLCTTTYINPPRQVARRFLCDGIKDCPDNSDEDASFCASFDCSSEGSLTCPGAKQCIPLISSNNTFGYPYGSYPTSGPSTICDDVKDCSDGSDEDPGLCSSYVCENDSFKCSNICIGRSKVCDGHIDCPDGGSDEDPDLCGPGYNCSLAGYYDGGDQHCPSGVGCYPGQSRACDGVYDCFDGSDEDPTFCASNACSDYEIRCPSGVGCILNDFLCDGTYNCIDKSDEGADFCASYTCTSGHIKCPSGNGGCLNYFQICDGTIENCLDGSDESEATCRTYDCGPGRERCPSGVGCVNSDRLCDGIPGNGISICKDGSDEDPTFCANRTQCPMYGQIRCRNGTCIYGELCDGTAQCADVSDEDTSYCQSANCPLGLQKCADDIHCVGQYALCDGRLDCADASDESSEYCNSFTCQNEYLSKCPGGSGQCFSNTTLCDGVADCRDGSDEDPSFCASYDCTSTVQLFGTINRFKCPGTNVCVWGNLCNGNPDCPDHSDESLAICNSGEPPASRPSAPPPSEPGAPPPTTASPPESPGSPPPTTANPPESPEAPPPTTASPPESSEAPPPTNSEPGAPPPVSASPPQPPKGSSPITYCDPYSSLPNQCFNAQGTASICCPGQCPNTPGDAPFCGTPGPSPATCDPTSLGPNQCFNANGDQSVCCPGSCPGSSGPVARCG